MQRDGTDNSQTTNADLDEIDFDDVYFDDEEGTEEEQEMADAITGQETEEEKKDLDTDEEENSKNDDDANKEESEEKEKATEEENEETTEEGSLFEEMSARFGFQVEGEFEDSEEGLIEFTKAAGQQFARQELDNLFKQYPDLKEIFEFRTNGGKLEDYVQAETQATDYAAIDEIKEDDADLQAQLVRDALVLQGLDDEDIKDQLEDLRTGGLLHKTAERSLKALQKHAATEKERLVEQQTAAAEAQRKEAEAFWTETKKTIDAAPNFEGVPIPEADKGDFFDFISKPQPEHNGLSRRDAIAQSLTLEDRLMLDAILYQTKVKKVPLSTIIEKKASSSSARGLRDRVRKQQRADRAAGDTPEREKGTQNLDDIDFDALS